MPGSKLAASVTKELLLIIRDRAGMALLFVMPAFLVIVITLIQDKVTTTTTEVLFVDEDHGRVALEIHKVLGQTGTLRLIERIEGRDITANSSKELVAEGRYQFAIIIPSGLSQRVALAAKEMVQGQLFSTVDGTYPAAQEILIWFDPTVHGSFRAAVSTAVNRALQGIETRLFVENIIIMLPQKMASGLPANISPSLLTQDLAAIDILPQLFEDTSLVSVRQRFATAMGFSKQPTAVQQNVPAWAIFGIFFIVVPLAGSLINERETGTLDRLESLPVSYFTFISGKIISYALVCIVQFMVILLAGVHVLPMLGLAAFDPGNAPMLFALLIFSVVAAACGYGILLGTIGRTYEQIAVSGPLSIVIAAAIGGIMVPIYALPETMRPLCALSPLYWGQSGFYDLLLREANLQAILPEVLSLFGFCLLAMAGAFLFSRRKRTAPPVVQM